MTIYWVVYYFRGRRKTGSSMVDRRKGEQDFDLSAIRAAAPDWLKEIACDIEMKVRPLREALAQLRDADRALRVSASRLGISLDENPAPPTPHRQDDADARAPLEAEMFP